MAYAGTKRLTRRSFWRVGINILFIAFTLLVAKDLAAQKKSSTQAVEPGILADQPDLTGSWLRAYVGPNYSPNGDADSLKGKVGSFGFVEDEACLERKDALGNPLKRCSLPFNELKKNYLNKRALAWLEFADERLSSKWRCAPPTVPVLLDMGTWTFNQVAGTEWQLDILSPTVGTVRRTIWMDGRTHQSPIHLSYEGDTIGWFEGKELVVETTNFTFDPTGLEDHSLLPSSHMKKVTERYKRISPDKLNVTVTVEDPIFLKKPFTWSFELTKVPAPTAERNVCDPDDAQFELDSIAPDRYKE